MDVNTLCQTVGVVGYLFYMFGFAALQSGKLDGNGNTYALISIFAAFCVLVGLWAAFNLASALIQVSWIVIGSFGVLRRVLFQTPREPSTNAAAGAEYSPVARAPAAGIAQVSYPCPAPRHLPICPAPPPGSDRWMSGGVRAWP